MAKQLQDVVERLRAPIPPGRAWCREAADEIERLREQSDALAVPLSELIIAYQDADSPAIQATLNRGRAAIRALKEQK